ncbi:uncharacterized protein LOC136041860 [Artemia franciscana]|uniref:UDENN FLCN/SMCR8-type domain-containing protein n=1 Tax=Artemia franciscana TaxID=6661 RepID=A0AA88HU97_ARTSF|nr:hypothetical protein QYM36_010785 [Artemia franciscana]
MKDYCVLAEFSEIHGPSTLICVPSDPQFQSKINSMVLRIMTVDYQPPGRLHSRLLYNTYALLNHIVPGVNGFVTYFTLYDPDARGFVRPACLLFLSKCFEKLSFVMKELRADMVKIIDKMKSANCSLIQCHPLATTALFTSTSSFQTSDLGSSFVSGTMHESTKSTQRLKSVTDLPTTKSTKNNCSKRFSLDSSIGGTLDSSNSMFTSIGSSGISFQSTDVVQPESVKTESSPKKKPIKSLFATCGISKNIILPYVIRLHGKYSRAFEEILLEAHV